MENSSISDTVRFYRQLPINSLYGVIFLVGFSANLWVLYLATRKSKVKPITTILILNLAAADLLMITCLPVVIAHSYAQDWIFGMTACKIYYTVDAVSKVSSISFLILLSLDRYLAVCWPVKSKPLRTTWVAVGAAAVTWLLDSVIMAPVYLRATLIASEDQQIAPNVTSSGKIHCVALWSDELEQMTNGLMTNSTNNETSISTLSQRRIFTFYTFFLNYLLPLLLIWTFYLLILRRLSKRQSVLFMQKRRRHHHIRNTTLITGMFAKLVTHKKSTGSEINGLIVQNERLCAKNGVQDNSYNNSTVPGDNGFANNRDRTIGAQRPRRRRSRRLTITILTIVVIYTVCWMPFWVVQLTLDLLSPVILKRIDSYFSIFSYVAYALQWTNSAANPLIYALGSRTYRRNRTSGHPKRRTTPNTRDKRRNEATAAECCRGGVCRGKDAKIVADVVAPLSVNGSSVESCRVFSVKFSSRSDKCNCGQQQELTPEKNSALYGVEECSSVG